MASILSWFFGRRNRKRWRNKIGRRTAYAELSLAVAMHARAAKRGHYIVDSNILTTIARQLRYIGNQE
jgi:hypothetical protein